MFRKGMVNRASTNLTNLWMTLATQEKSINYNSIKIN